MKLAGERERSRRRWTTGRGMEKSFHLVVQDDAGFGHDELAAEEQVDGRGERDGHPGGVCGDDVGGAMPG